MTGSAQIDFFAGEESSGTFEQGRAAELRAQVAERLDSHRQRRTRQPQEALEAVAEPARASSAKRKIAAAVAERYAQTPSYRAFLAEEALRAIAQAAAAAEVARRNAEAIEVEQQRLLSELALWDAPQEFTSEALGTLVAEAGVSDLVAAPETNQKINHAVESGSGITVRLYEDLGPAPRLPQDARRSDATRKLGLPDAAEAMVLDAEIAFRQAPVFEELGSIEPPVPLAANLLEFPRQLIAARRARPRLAEGPLLEEAKARTRQLRIFEVEPELISTAPLPVVHAPEWSSIRLDAHTVTAVVENPDAPAMPVLASLLPPQTAAIGLRVMAAMVDGLLVTTGLVAFAAVFTKMVGAVPIGLPVAIAAGATLVLFYVLYQALFFTFNGQTPGMRYARIGLCTFTDENPSRSAMRKRILAQFIAVCPLGLGLLWALLDDDGLGWHDRISKMYPRAY